MLLCIDIGNTHTVIGLFWGQQPTHTWRLNTVHDATADEYGLRLCALLEQAKVQPSSLSGVALCSVVPQLTQTFHDLCQRYLNQSVFLVDHTVRLDMSLLVDRPQEVGADRIVNCVAAKALVGGPACVVDLGTATKFDVLSSDGDFLGGVIAPGLGIAADALFSRASKLYRVSLARPERVIGRNTVEAMQSGVVLGYLTLVEGMIDRIQQEVGANMHVIATGGLAPVIVENSPSIHRFEPGLTLEGLSIIWALNHPEHRWLQA